MFCPTDEEKETLGGLEELLNVNSQEKQLLSEAPVYKWRG